ncbi:MAG: Uncharacterised protein [Prochlorococcus marinus str. MIT 9215]|nr:MAG: Uncharacterised protein [Prochlorococcus marinus str. MIT 9215]
MLIKGCGTDATQFTTGQHRLEQVACIHGAAAGTSADNGVNFIDEQHNLAIGGGDFFEHRFEALFEFTPIFCAGNQGAHIESN